jgi:hypothetical protein
MENNNNNNNNSSSSNFTEMLIILVAEEWRLLGCYAVWLCHPDDGGATFLRNVGSYKSHTA